MYELGSGNGFVQFGGIILQIDYNVFSWESGEQGGGEGDFDGLFGLFNGVSIIYEIYIVEFLIFFQL